MVQMLGILAGAGVNRISRRLQCLYLERVLFHHRQLDTRAVDFADFPTRFVPLGVYNFKQALTASGAIFYVMEGVTDIPGAPKGIYRDGGMLDYHPAVALSPEQKGLILYPHFYPYIVPGWFDKKHVSRRVTGAVTDRIMLLTTHLRWLCRPGPSPLPGQ
jgi:hypothetical protein